ncbi:MAG: hypothetical protein WC108_04435 [Bacteroidales bacterium]
MSDENKEHKNEETETQVHKLTKTILANGKKQVHEEEEITKRTTIEMESDKVSEENDEEKEDEEEEENNENK